MKKYPIGISVELDDTRVLAMIEAAGIAQVWKDAVESARVNNSDATFIFNNGRRKERWVIEQFTRPGDDGLILTVIPFAIVNHPDVLGWWAITARKRGLREGYYYEFETPAEDRN